MTERRREARHAAEGIVELVMQAPMGKTITAALVDLSARGFRARHDELSLGTGDRVRYRHAGGAGTAVVIWTRVFDGRVESGLYTAFEK